MVILNIQSFILVSGIIDLFLNHSYIMHHLHSVSTTFKQSYCYIHISCNGSFLSQVIESNKPNSIDHILYNTTHIIDESSCGEHSWNWQAIVIVIVISLLLAQLAISEFICLTAFDLIRQTMIFQLKLCCVSCT